MVALSIVIPVYNVENYLDRCIGSVIVNNSDVEILLIDDGSTDSSSEIADTYAKLNENIKVIHKHNAGLSEARNDGIRNANGKFIVFLDSDDYLLENAVEVLLERIRQYPDYDIIFYEVICKNVEGRKTIEKKNIHVQYECLRGTDVLKDELNSGRFKAMSVIGLYNKDFLVNNKLFFRKGILHEDEEWSPRVLYCANKVISTTDKIYGYELRKDSITTKKDKTRNAECLMEICEELERYFAECSDKELVKLEFRYLAKLYMGAVSRGINSGRKQEVLEKCDKEFVRDKGITIQDKIRTAIFRASPQAYSRLFGFLD